MKWNRRILLLLILIVAVVGIILRITDGVSSQAFGLMGLVLAMIGFVCSRRSSSEAVEQAKVDIQDKSNPIRTRYKFMVVIITFIGLLYLCILVFGMVSQFVNGL
ncbi:hypothetical protein NV379_16785 [Paenibacillus sp. N1-5-1-14]|uniref:hypothetical protein n=1 Tax=Paenibacillus radicibacter TaxID=2972488 RepID=UPI002158B293|nr:hypothetical protein [Paenibacillus radicibacter]MCR8644311.1 hypothetical protein [Paenibacillus radicibacter]